MHWASQKQKGFTIVELLIVVVVIAILAAITIVSYNGINNRARESAVASMASQAQKKLATYAVLNGDRYPSTLAEAGISDSLAANLQYSVNNSTSPAGFCITASQNGISSYAASGYQYTTTSTQTVNQANPSPGLCPGHAANNGPTVTNLVTNPALRSVATGWSAVSSTGGTPSGARVTSVSGLSNLGITTAYRNTLGGAAGTWWRVQNSSGISVSEGTTYTLTGYIRPSVATLTGVIIIWHNAAGSTIVETASSPFLSHAANTWTQRSVTATAPAGAVLARLQFAASGGGVAGAYLDATAAMFYAGSSIYEYGDGDKADWIWEGVSNASTSRGPAL